MTQQKQQELQTYRQERNPAELDDGEDVQQGRGPIQQSEATVFRQ